MALSGYPAGTRAVVSVGSGPPYGGSVNATQTYSVPPYEVSPDGTFPYGLLVLAADNVTELVHVAGRFGPCPVVGGAVQR